MDFSKPLLDLAKKTAKQEKINLDLIYKDMRKINFRNEFDAVITLFSSFGYFSQQKENIIFLKKINQSLKPKGKFLLDLLNGDYLFKKTSKLSKKIWWKAGNNHVLLEDCSSNDSKKAIINYLTIITPTGEIKHTCMFMKIYDLPEIKKYLKEAGFKILKLYGDYQGKKFTKYSPRILILAQKIK